MSGHQLTYLAIFVGNSLRKLVNFLFWSCRESNKKHLDEVLLLHPPIWVLVHHHVKVLLHKLKCFLIRSLLKNNSSILTSMVANLVFLARYSKSLALILFLACAFPMLTTMLTPFTL